MSDYSENVFDKEDRMGDMLDELKSKANWKKDNLDGHDCWIAELDGTLVCELAEYSICVEAKDRDGLSRELDRYITFHEFFASAKGKTFEQYMSEFPFPEWILKLKELEAGE